MGALRKAGVWLGLVEDDDEHEYDEPAYDKGYTSNYRDRGGRRGERGDDRYGRGAGRYDDLGEDDDEDLDEAPAVPRTRVAADRSGSARLEAARESARAEATRLNVEARLEAARAERATVRPITANTRPLTATTSTASTRDNLALAPVAQPQQRVAPVAEDNRPQITTLHPTTYNEARQIGERFRDGTPVIMNLTEMDEADAKRLVDFAAGLAFGLRGTIERVTNRVFLLSPANVQVTAEDKAKIAEGGYLNQS
ncbi:cell division protein SepF [Catellatospora tritici]|uniref:cell division protein SepF n=1 Tax=Catellatospora tritici TaxID=2851566 RepID=UPI001C2D4224|nr:cell division protein SepF [Catellatospora tritici]MBV1852453.1 cell division protein SepF [Catellatospora tritici]